MPPRTRPPFRADHVGSLLRPPRLMQARADHAEGAISAADLRAVEDECIREAVAMQRDVGLRSATDGEFRRASWHMDYIYQLGGVSQVEGERIHVKFRNDEGEYDFAPPAMRVDGPVRIERTIFGDAFAFLRDTVAGATPKLTIPSPSMVHYRGGNSAIDPAVYPDLDAFWTDLVTAYADEVARLSALGCTYLQLDDTSLAYVNDPAQREHILAIGGDPEHLHETYIENINRALADRPDGLAVTTHMCRGNAQSMWAAEGSYDFVAEALFSGLEVDGFFLEYDDARSGGFEPLRFVPPGKCVVLGLVTTKRPLLECKDALKRRIEQAARFVDIDQLCLSPQCGFSSTVEGNRLTIGEEVAKLRLVVETAEEVWWRGRREVDGSADQPSDRAAAVDARGSARQDDTFALGSCRQRAGRPPTRERGAAYSGSAKCRSRCGGFEQQRDGRLTRSRSGESRRRNSAARGRRLRTTPGRTIRARTDAPVGESGVSTINPGTARRAAPRGRRWRG